MNCRLHCFIWFASGATLYVGCAHCPAISKKIPDFDEALLDRQCGASRASHERLCPRARQGGPVRRRPTTYRRSR